MVAGLRALGFCALISGAWAGDGAGPGPVDWASRLERAKSLQAQGLERKKEAKDQFAGAKKACFARFRVTDCQHAAKQDYVHAMGEARKIENEGLALERQVKSEQRAQHQQKMADDAPQRAESLRLRQERVQAEQEAARAEQAARREGKARQAEEGERRHRANAQRLQEKRQKHADRVAEKMAKARRRAETAD